MLLGFLAALVTAKLLNSRVMKAVPTPFISRAAAVSLADACRGWRCGSMTAASCL